MTFQTSFGGAWTEQKLRALSKYLKAYTTIFKKNPKARHYSITYVDAFAGTGKLQRPNSSRFESLLPELSANEEQYRKGSVKRALEVSPPFDKYVFIERSARKCRELREISKDFPSLRIEVLNEDANRALLSWCQRLDSQSERAVVFLDPFGASVHWEVIATLGRTRAVDLWVLFPYSAINRMLIRNRKPPKQWAERLTAVFGTPAWEQSFYSGTSFRSLLNPSQRIESVYKSADYRDITNFFIKRLEKEFVAVSRPLLLLNSTGSLLFTLFFAAGNDRSASTGLKIANDIIGR